MRTRVNILYILLWVLVILFSFSMFPVWRINVAFSGALVTGIGYWLYGKRYRFLLAGSWIIYHSSLCEVYGDILESYQSRFFANLLMVLLAFLISELRENYDFQKETTKKLDDAVAARNREWAVLVAGLIDRRERMRNEQGEELHNGVGQEMTGIQLYCEMLSEKAAATRNPAESLIASLRAGAQETHRIIRWTARTLFPVKIAEAGLLASLRELVSCLEESQDVEFAIEADTDSFPIPNVTALQLYRIAQETLFYVLKHTDARKICLDLEEQAHEYRLDIIHNGQKIGCGDTMGVDIRVIEYRLRKILGVMTTSSPHAGLEKITYTVPRAVHNVIC